MTAHGYGPYTRGCRCAVCVEAKRIYQAKLRERARAAVEVPDHVRHGSVATYVDYRCRCDACTAAKRAYGRRQHDEWRRSPNVPHGTNKGYTHYACRCGACRLAYSRYCRTKKRAA